MKRLKEDKNITKRLSIWAIVVMAILAIPFLTKAPWTAGDYIFAGVVLFTSASTYELATKRMSNKTHRVAVAVAIIMVIVLIWGWAVA